MIDIYCPAVVSYMNLGTRSALILTVLTALGSSAYASECNLKSLAKKKSSDAGQRELFFSKEPRDTEKYYVSDFLACHQHAMKELESLQKQYPDRETVIWITYKGIAFTIHSAISPIKGNQKACKLQTEKDRWEIIKFIRGNNTQDHELQSDSSFWNCLQSAHYKFIEELEQNGTLPQAQIWYKGPFIQGSYYQYHITLNASATDVRQYKEIALKEMKP